MNAPVRLLRALDTVAPPEPHCTACQASLFGVPVACDFHRERHAQQQRAAASRAQKPETQARQRAEETAAIERRLERLARARKQQRRRMTLTTEDTWRGGVSSVYGMGES